MDLDEDISTEINQFILLFCLGSIQFLYDFIHDVAVVVYRKHVAEISSAVALRPPAVSHIRLERIGSVGEFSWWIQKWLFLLEFDPLGRYLY